MVVLVFLLAKYILYILGVEWTCWPSSLRETRTCRYIVQQYYYNYIYIFNGCCIICLDDSGGLKMSCHKVAAFYRFWPW